MSALLDFFLSLFRRLVPPVSPVPPAIPSMPSAAPWLQRTSPRGREFIKGKESCRLVAYPDPKTGGAPYTCGWGETAGVTKDTVWTQAQADARFEQSLAFVESLVRLNVVHSTTQGQFDAFVSIIYNVGPGSWYRDGIIRLKSGQPSTLLRKFNEGDMGGCETEWLKWISPGSNVAHGLYLRRNGELDMFRS